MTLQGRFEGIVVFSARVFRESFYEGLCLADGWKRDKEYQESA